MKILIFNWKDIKNPFAGGAEVFTHEISKRFVNKYGCEVTIFTSEFPNCKSKEKIGGVNIIRKGTKNAVYYYARKYYNKFFKGEFDIVIDECNTLPFFTPLYVKEKKVFFIHQLARKIWFYETNFPLNVVGYFLEPLYLQLYRNIPTITVSDSTKSDLLKLGFKKIHLVPEGIDFKPLEKVPKKEKNPTLIYVGRLKKSKRVHHVIQAFKLIKEKIPNSKLWIVGDGEEKYVNYLKEIVKKNELRDVIFFGRLDKKEKNKLISRAHVLLISSVREGWGLVVTEANALGTPAVGYKVHGLRDSIVDNINGILVKKESPYALFRATLNLLKDEASLRKMSRNALIYSKRFSWDITAREYFNILKKLNPKNY